VVTTERRLRRLVCSDGARQHLALTSATGATARVTRYGRNLFGFTTWLAGWPWGTVRDLAGAVAIVDTFETSGELPGGLVCQSWRQGRRSRRETND
jgi:hypothetical protein